MSIGRIQKLMKSSEYLEFDERVLTENAFAEVTKSGVGYRQVEIALTLRNIIIASDTKEHNMEYVNNVFYTVGFDPYIENFELIAVYPMNCIHLSCFRLGSRHILRVRFAAKKKTKYYEFGGSPNKYDSSWLDWCKTVDMLQTSTTYDSSSSAQSVLDIVSMKIIKERSGKNMIWCQYGLSPSPSERRIPSVEIVNEDCTRQIEKEEDNIRGNKEHTEQTVDKKELEKQKVKGNKQAVSKKGKKKGEKENEEQAMKKKESSKADASKQEHNEANVMTTSTKTPKDDNKRSKDYNSSSLPAAPQKRGSVRINRFGSGIPENCANELWLSADHKEAGDKEVNKGTDDVASHTVKKWVSDSSNYIQNVSGDTRRFCVRQYAVFPKPFFYHGLGLWSTIFGESHVFQVKHVMSEAHLEKSESFPSLIQHSKSCEELRWPSKHHKKPRSVYFWTPQKEQEMIKLLRKHNRNNHKRADHAYEKQRQHKRTKLGDEIWSDHKYLSIWEFESSELAEQLTMIDRNLFLKIEPNEISILIKKRRLKYAHNIYEFILFSYRISCLVVTQILKETVRDFRSAVIIKFIKAAEKCYAMKNFHSCRSILAGLQSPSIYRLRYTWAYLKNRHRKRYLVFKKLCLLYEDTRLLLFQKTFNIASLKPPFLPYFGDIINCLLNLTPVFADYIVSGSFENDSQNSNIEVVGKVNKKGINSIENISFTENTDENIVTGNGAANKEKVCKPQITASLSHLNHSSFKANKNHFLQRTVSLSYTSVTSVTSSLPSDSSAGMWENYEEMNKGMTIIVEDPHEFFTPNLSILDVQNMRLNEMKYLLHKYQAAAEGYCFPPTALGREFLLKSKYLDEYENFIKSCNLEKK